MLSVSARTDAVTDSTKRPETSRNPPLWLETMTWLVSLGLLVGWPWVSGAAHVHHQRGQNLSTTPIVVNIDFGPRVSYCLGAPG